MMVEPKKIRCKVECRNPSNKGGAAADEELYKILKELCREVAKEEDLPPM